MAQVFHLEERPEGILPELPFHKCQPVAADEVAAGELVPGGMDERSLLVQIEVSHLTQRLELCLFAFAKLLQALLPVG